MPVLCQHFTQKSSLLWRNFKELIGGQMEAITTAINQFSTQKVNSGVLTIFLI
jgi:hypothetical protein